jgi:hypothetical protein
MRAGLNGYGLLNLRPSLFNLPLGSHLFSLIVHPHHFPLSVSLSRIMVRTRFYDPAAKSSRRTQGLARKFKRRELSKEVRAAQVIQRRQAAQSFKKDIDDAWAQINEATETIAANHHKSVHRVQGDLYMGRSLSLAKHSKTSAWNAFCWKKNISLKVSGNESKRCINVIYLMIF